MELSGVLPLDGATLEWSKAGVGTIRAVFRLNEGDAAVWHAGACFPFGQSLADLAPLDGAMAQEGA